MLRVFVLFLLMLNAVYFAWGHGWLLPYGYGPARQSEPQRLAQQIRPQAIQLMTAAEVEASKAQLAAVQSKPLCLQSAVFDLARAEAVRAVLEGSFPEGAWALEEAATPERWILYMGKYENATELAKKRAQLTTLGLRFESVNKSALAPGLSLGAFASEAKAISALAALAQRGVRTARVQLESPSAPGLRLRLPALDDELQKRLPTVRTALSGLALLPCATVGEPG